MATIVAVETRVAHPAPTAMARMPGVADLVQRYLDQIVEEYAGVADGTPADYIPELTEVDPSGCGLTLSSSDGFLYESGDARTEFTSSRSPRRSLSERLGLHFLANRARPSAPSTNRSNASASTSCTVT
jgi:hypothetical protein